MQMKIQKIKSFLLPGTIVAGFVALSMLSACGGGHDVNNDKETPGRGIDTTGRDMNEEDYVQPTSLAQPTDESRTYRFYTL
jgi:hypothetical protein